SRAALEDAAGKVGRGQQGVGLAHGPAFVSTSREGPDQVEAIVDVREELVPGTEQGREGRHDRERVPEPAGAHAALRAPGLALLEKPLNAPNGPVDDLADDGSGRDPTVFALRR